MYRRTLLATAAAAGTTALAGCDGASSAEDGPDPAATPVDSTPTDEAAGPTETPEPGEPTATIPRTAGAPTIDGAPDDAWSPVEARALSSDLWGTSGIDAEASWRALWDEEALYVLVEVTDPDRHVDSDGAWNDDHVEVYLDVDHSRGDSYDGVDDMQLIVRRGESQIRPGANSASPPAEAAAATTETDDGWRLEMAVPWAPFAVTPSRGTLLGFDVHANDDQDGGDRDGKIAWFADSDASFEDPSTFGTVALGE